MEASYSSVCCDSARAMSCVRRVSYITHLITSVTHLIFYHAREKWREQDRKRRSIQQICFSYIYVSIKNTKCNGHKHVVEFTINNQNYFNLHNITITYICLALSPVFVYCPACRVYRTIETCTLYFGVK